jgi:hypothetical protein
MADLAHRQTSLGRMIASAWRDSPTATQVSWVTVLYRAAKAWLIKRSSRDRGKLQLRVPAPSCLVEWLREKPDPVRAGTWHLLWLL